MWIGIGASTRSFEFPPLCVPSGNACTTRLLTHVPSLSITALKGGWEPHVTWMTSHGANALVCQCSPDPFAELYSHPPPGLWPVLSVPSRDGPRTYADYIHALLPLAPGVLAAMYTSISSPVVERVLLLVVQHGSCSPWLICPSDGLYLLAAAPSRPLSCRPHTYNLPPQTSSLPLMLQSAKTTPEASQVASILLPLPLLPMAFCHLACPQFPSICTFSFSCCDSPPARARGSRSRDCVDQPVCLPLRRGMTPALL